MTDSGESVTPVQSLYEGGNGPYNAWVEFPVTGIVKAWVEEGAPNHGILIWQTPIAMGGENQELQFATNEHANPALHPQLLLCTEFGRVDVPAEPAPMPSGIGLRVTPNPSRGMSVITLDLPVATRGEVGIFDISGRCVRNLVPLTDLPAGSFSAAWDGNNDRGVSVGAGLYLVTVQSGAGTSVAKVSLNR